MVVGYLEKVILCKFLTGSLRENRQVMVTRIRSGTILISKLKRKTTL